MLKMIRVTNFKSISNEPVLLENFNVLIGANAAGKSNFVDALRFIYDVNKDRLSSAIGKRLGWENVLTREKDKRDKIAVAILCELSEMEETIRIRKKGYDSINVEYNFETGYSKKRYFIDSEIFIAQFKKKDSEYIERFDRNRNKAKIPIHHKAKEEIRSFRIPSQMKDSLFLPHAYPNLSVFYLTNFIRDWRFYDLDVNVARRPCYEDSQGFLLEDGHNLASILDGLRTLKTEIAKSIRRQILNMMPTLIPGFEDWKTEQLYDGSLGFSIKEKGITKPLLPKMVSDGTIRLLSILLALLYQPYRARLICLDEPERYLHPQVLEPLIEIMRTVSKKTQLIVTTHSAELVKYLKPNEVLMVDKKDNVTHIVRAKDIEMVDKFLEEFTLDELWLGGYLKGGKII